MFSQDKLPNNKDITCLERKETKHPLLQIFYRNKNNNLLTPTGPKTSTISASTGLLLNKNSNNTTLNITPKLDLTKTFHFLSNEKPTNSHIGSDVNNNSSRDKKPDSQEDKKNKYTRRLVNKRKTVNSTKTVIFPYLKYNSTNTNMIRLQKKGAYENIINEKNNENDIIYNNTKYNNNSIYVSEPGKNNNNIIFQRFKGDKVLCQKIIELSLNKKNSSNNNNNNLYKISTTNDSQHPPLNTDNNDKNIDNSNKNNSLINKFMREKNEMDKKFAKRKSVNYSSFNDFLKTETDNNTDTIQNNRYNKDKPKGMKKSFLAMLNSFPNNNNNQNKNNNLTNSLLTFVPETKALSPLARQKINIRKFSSKLNKKKSQINLASFKRSILRKKTGQIQMHNNNDEGLKALANIRKSTRHVTLNIFNQKSNLLFNNKDIKINNNLNKIFDEESEYSDSSQKIIIVHKKNNYYDLNSFLNKQYINKDEEQYFQKKRLKIIDAVEKSNKSSNVYNSYNEEIKNYFLKNYVIDKITQNIFNNFEPLDNKTENKKEIIHQREISLKYIFNDILIKSHKFCYSFEKMQKLGISYLKKVKIKTQLIIKNNYILGKFDIYNRLLRQFKSKWKKQKNKENNYKKRLNLLESRNNNIDNKYKKNLNLFGTYDAEICIYRERIETDLHLNINRLDIVLKEEENKKENNSKSKRRQSTLKFLRKLYNSNSILRKGNILNSLGPDSKTVENTEGTTRKKTLKEENNERKMSNSIKIEKEFGLINRTDSFQRFAKLYRISSFPKKMPPIIPENETKTINVETEQIMNKLKSKLEHFNILKNRKIFHFTNNKKLNFEKRFSQIVKKKKSRIQLDKKLKIDTMTIKFAGIDQLTKEASLIKTHEMEKHLPDVRLFDKFVSLLLRRKLNQFDFLIQSKEERFNRIINKQEFSTGNTLLIYATQNNLKSVVELLLLKGADPNIQNKFGNSALHIAYKNDNAFIINLLFEHGADQKIKNSNGLFPWQMSRTINN